MDLFHDDKRPDLVLRQPTVPLADRIRPRRLDEFVGQTKAVGEGSSLRQAILRDSVASLIFWGPPGTGKTTLAHLIAKATQGQFILFSAVTSGIKEVKEVMSKAAGFRKLSGRRTYLFVDEIHRFNRAQQDAFLPYVESGDIVLIGATTENPSFTLNAALLSRMQVVVLERLEPEGLMEILRRGLTDTEQGLGLSADLLKADALELMAEAADGDARRALTILEQTVEFVGAGSAIDSEAVRKAISGRALVYDRAGEEHFNIISALHKTIRGGDPDAALYWLARMIESGEDPRYIARRLVRTAYEDIGLADPNAQTVALNAQATYLALGSPEGELAIAAAVVYLACAPKSNAVYIGFGAARKDALEHGSLPVPHCLRNAPTRLMKGLGYGEGYEYAHDAPEGITANEYFPDQLKGTRYFHPTDAGREKRLAEYLAWYKQQRHGRSVDHE